MFFTMVATSALFLALSLAAASDIQEVIVKPGGNVTLQCRAPGGAPIRVVEWRRADLGPGVYVFFFRDNQSVESFQLPSYRGQVAFREPNMEKGDASVILWKVNSNYIGTYECSIVTGNSTHPELISTIKLKVEDSGHKDGHTDEGNKDGGETGGRNKDEGNNYGLTIGVSVSVIVVVVVVVVVVLVVVFKIHKKCKSHTKKNAHQPADEDQQENIPMTVLD